VSFPGAEILNSDVVVGIDEGVISPGRGGGLAVLEDKVGGCIG